MTSPGPTISDLLSDQGGTPDANTKACTFASTWLAHHQARPVHLVVLSGIGAILSAAALAFLIGAVLMRMKLYGDSPFLTVAFMLLLAAAVLRKQRDMSSVFLSLVLSTVYLTGCGFFLFGSVDISHQPWSAPLAFALLTIFTGLAFGTGPAFAVCLTATLVGFLLSGLRDILPTASLITAFVVSGYITMLATLTVVIMAENRRGIRLRWVIRAIFTAISLLLLAKVLSETSTQPDDHILANVPPLLISAGLLITALAGYFLAVPTTLRAPREPVILAFTGFLLLGLLSAPGLLFALMLLVLGYYRSDRFLTGSGTLQLPLFLFFYYYNLDVDLLQKSGFLVLGGLILLAGYSWIRYRGWDHTPEPHL